MVPQGLAGLRHNTELLQMVTFPFSVLFCYSNTVTSGLIMVKASIYLWITVLEISLKKRFVHWPVVVHHSIIANAMTEDNARVPSNILYFQSTLISLLSYLSTEQSLHLSLSSLTVLISPLPQD